MGGSVVGRGICEWNRSGIESLRRNGLIPMEARDKQQSDNLFRAFDRKHRHGWGFRRSNKYFFLENAYSIRYVRILSNTVLLDLTEIGQRIDGAYRISSKPITCRIKSGSCCIGNRRASGLYQSR